MKKEDKENNSNIDKKEKEKDENKSESDTEVNENIYENPGIKISKLEIINTGKFTNPIIKKK